MAQVFLRPLKDLMERSSQAIFGEIYLVNHIEIWLDLIEGVSTLSIHSAKSKNQELTLRTHDTNSNLKTNPLR